MRLVLAEQYEGGQPRILAGSILLRYGNTVFYAFNGRRRQDLSLHPNDLIQWHAIHDACEDRFQRYDFGEVPMGNEGLDQFKRKWGAATTQLYRYYYPAPRDAVDGSIEPDSLVRRLASRCWQLLPLPVTGAVGGLIYGYL
jgi:lipid II:glycine glycyltransferase (peptidoglycan interpeptide bridge formation enzyme)